MEFFWYIPTASSAFRRGNESPLLGAEIIVTCAILHLAFLAFFFGNQWSWIYYSYLPIIGCAIALNFGPTWRMIGFGICVIAILSWSGTAYWLSRQWQTTSLDASAGRLWTTSDESIELTRVSRWPQQKHGSDRWHGRGRILFPDLESPVSLFLVRGLMTPSEIARKNLQLSTAEMVIAPIQSGPCDGVAEVAEFNRGMKNLSDCGLVNISRYSNEVRSHDGTFLEQPSGQPALWHAESSRNTGSHFTFGGESAPSHALSVVLVVCSRVAPCRVSSTLAVAFVQLLLFRGSGH